MKKLFCIVYNPKIRNTTLIERDVDKAGCVLTPVFRDSGVTSAIGTLRADGTIHGLTGTRLGKVEEWFDDIEAKRREFWSFDFEKAEKAFCEIQTTDEFTTLITSLIQAPSNEATLQ